MADDRVENINLLEPYWPQSSGAILITSRSWINFNFDPQRKGTTVQPFDETERWEVLCKLLSWETGESTAVEDGEYLAVDGLSLEDKVSADDLEAARTILQESVGFGLALALQLTASLIKARQTNQKSIRSLLEDFVSHSDSVPNRPPHDSLLNTSHTVDTLYSIAFAALSTHAKAFLNVLCFLSPDVTQDALFNPKDQGTLSPMLDFCKQEQRRLGTLSPELLEVIKELQQAALIKREGRILSIHRVVQEAFYYLLTGERQAAFEAAVRLVNEAFPKQIHGRPFHKVWERCELYIQEVLFLTQKFEHFRKSEFPVSAPPEFGELLKNAAW